MDSVHDGQKSRFHKITVIIQILCISAMVALIFYRRYYECRCCNCIFVCYNFYDSRDIYSQLLQIPPNHVIIERETKEESLCQRREK